MLTGERSRASCGVILVGPGTRIRPLGSPAPAVDAVFDGQIDAF